MLWGTQHPASGSHFSPAYSRHSHEARGRLWNNVPPSLRKPGPLQPKHLTPAVFGDSPSGPGSLQDTKMLPTPGIQPLDSHPPRAGRCSESSLSMFSLPGLLSRGVRRVIYPGLSQRALASPTGRGCGTLIPGCSTHKGDHEPRGLSGEPREEGKSLHWAGAA